MRWYAILPIVLLAGVTAAFGDEFDALRLRWRDMLTMGTNANPADTNYASWITSIGSNARSTWNSLNTNVDRTWLWSSYNSLTNDSADITGTYGRLKTMALGYAVHGSNLETNADLRDAIISGLEWMYTNIYNETKGEYGNWWDWEIGTPLSLNDTVVLMYDDLTGTQVTNYLKAVDRFTPTPNMTGANQVWKASIVAVRGAVVKSSAKLATARDSLGNVWPYVTSGDGFYTDGSFIQHSYHPYTGGYGSALIGTLGPLLQFLSGSSWDITDPKAANLYRWIYDSYEPLIYRGAMTDMVRGREIARGGGQDHGSGHSVMMSILRIAQFAPPADALAFKRMIKYWVQADTYSATAPGPPANVWLNEILGDTNLAPRGELVRHYQFPHMDRVVHLRPGFGLGLAMSSSRIANFESINTENLHGWYTGEGLTYLYNGDLSQFGDNFWATVNPYRLPGTTVDTRLRTDGSGASYRSAYNWVGGAALGLYGAAGMQLDAWSSTLVAKKSWFMFDDEIVCLGAGISSTDNRPIETIVENRKLPGFGNNVFTADGVTKPGTLGWAETLSNLSWAHLAGNTTGADIGYYFPQSATVKGLREPRTGAWSDIDVWYGSTNRVTRNYFTIWFDHGANPTNATYVYVLLPNQPASKVAAYAAHPDIVVLENSPRAQGVKETTLGLTAINFWNDGTNSLGGVTVDKKASLLVQNDGTFLELAISDPTQANTNRINLEIAAASSGTLAADANVTVAQLSPTIRLSVNVKNAGGQTFHAKFFVGATQSVTLSPVADAYVQNGDQTNSNFGTSSALVVKLAGTTLTRESFLRFDLSSATGMVVGATLRIMPTTVTDPVTNALALVSDNSWTETGITWSNKPSSEASLANWIPEVNVPIEMPVVPQAQAALTGDKLLSFQISAVNKTTNGYVAYASREYGTASQRPQLILILGLVPPKVTLTSPANGAVFEAPATLALSADVQDSDGTVTNVEFFNGATKFAQFAAGPYSLTLSNLATGEHTFSAVASDNTGLASTSAPVTVCLFNPQPVGRGTGLFGDYFTNQNLTGLGLTRIDSTVNFSWGSGVPSPGVPADHFSVRWTGRVQARHAGLHTFHTVSDDGVRLWINGQWLIDNWSNHSATENTNSIFLLPGRYYDVIMEFYDNTGTATAKLYWTPPGGAKEVIPQSQLYPADTGLRGDYFASTNLTNLVFSRLDDAVVFYWGSNAPDASLPADAFSVRWTGQVRANGSGAYSFYTLTDGGVRLRVNGQLLIDDWTAHDLVENSNTLTLTVGQYYTFAMEYFHSGSNATAVLLCQPPSESKQVVPETNLTPHQNNNPPTLGVIPNLTTPVGSTTTFTVTAVDPDAPPQMLTYTLDPGAPSGAAVDATNGLFIWTMPPAQAPGDYPFTVRVTDNGTPAMTDAQTFTIAALPLPSLAITRSVDDLILSWPADSSAFVLCSATDLAPPVTWIQVPETPIFSNGQWIILLNAATNSSVFYRLVTP